MNIKKIMAKFTNLFVCLKTRAPNINTTPNRKHSQNAKKWLIAICVISTIFTIVSSFQVSALEVEQGAFEHRLAFAGKITRSTPSSTFATTWQMPRSYFDNSTNVIPDVVYRDNVVVDGTTYSQETALRTVPKDGVSTARYVVRGLNSTHGMSQTNIVTLELPTTILKNPDIALRVTSTSADVSVTDYEYQSVVSLKYTILNRVNTGLVKGYTFTYNHTFEATAAEFVTAIPAFRDTPYSEYYDENTIIVVEGSVTLTTFTSRQHSVTFQMPVYDETFNPYDLTAYNDALMDIELNTGTSQAYKEGYDKGYLDASDSGAVMTALKTLNAVTNSIDKLLAVQIVPNITIGMLVIFVVGMSLFKFFLNKHAGG